MKKLFFCTIVGVLIVCKASISQIRFGATTGVTFSKMYSKVDNQKDKSDMKTGFSAGLILNANLGDHFSFQPQLNFTQIGAKESEEDQKLTLSLNYIEMPVNFLYNTAGEKGRFFVGVGPSLAVGISGKMKYSYGGESVESKVKFGKDKDFSRANFGLNTLAGYKANGGLYVAVNYTYGLSNLYPSSDDGKLSCRYWGVKIGWLFGK